MEGMVGVCLVGDGSLTDRNTNIGASREGLYY